MYTINFTSTNTTIYRLSLNEIVSHLSDHFARLGADDEPIHISDSETGELYEVIEDEKLSFNHKFTTEIKHKEYNILQLMELIPYLDRI